MNYFLEITSTELLGHFASLAVLSSFLMKDMIKLRLINMLGCLLFVGYGILLDFSIPIIITNASIFLIHVYYLVKSRNIYHG